MTTHKEERMLTESQAALFLDTNHGALATLRKDGTAHVTPLWVDWDGKNVVINTAAGRLKERHMHRDPRVSILVIDQHNIVRYVSVTGTATIDAEGAEEHIDKLAKKYLGVDKYPEEARAPGERRVIVRIKPEIVTHWNVD
jgi:PPOX class probable F420-dependent enzyme